MIALTTQAVAFTAVFADLCLTVCSTLPKKSCSLLLEFWADFGLNFGVQISGHQMQQRELLMGLIGGLGIGTLFLLVWGLYPATVKQEEHEGMAAWLKR